MCFGSVGFLWALAWHRWFRDDPTEHAAVNDAELQHILAERPGDVPHAAAWHYWVTLVRSRSMLAYVFSGVALLFAASSSSPVAAALLIAIGTSACMCTLGAAWGTCIEIGRNHVGIVGATMNTAGQIASLMCPLIVAYSVDWFDNLGLAPSASRCALPGWAGCWLVIDPHKPIFGNDARARA